ncbi:13547_t:CDS:2, partial [Acaulospora colombiana]
KINTSVHERLLEDIQAVDINDLTYDNPLANGIIDLGSSQYQLMEDDYDVLASSENAFVDTITRLVEASMYQMPVEFDIEVTRNDRQSVASKKRKNRQLAGSRGNKPDLMIRAFFKQKWHELAYVESGKWKSTETKTLNDHNKLARLSLDGYTDMSKKN